MHYRVKEVEGVQCFQTHYDRAAVAWLNRVLMERGGRAGGGGGEVGRVSVLFRPSVCALSFH